VWKGGGEMLCSGEFWAFLFYFEVLKSSIFLFIILWVFKKQLCEVSQGGRGGYLPFFLWTLKVFCFLILKFRSF
jgi:hypothetical protein